MIEVAFIVATSAFSSSGGIARSLPAITNHAGFVFHAAVVIVAPKGSRGDVVIRLSANRLAW